MLELLHIENIAIIDRADITFEPGFNALTGETGAGKSIVIDSLSAVLGQRTSRDPHRGRQGLRQRLLHRHPAGGRGGLGHHMG